MTGGSKGTPGDNIGSTPVGIIGSISGEPLEINVETPRTGATPSAKEHIEGHLSALRSLLKEHNGRGNVSPIRLSFDNAKDRTRVWTVVTGAEVRDADLKRPFKEARIISVDSRPRRTLVNGPCRCGVVCSNKPWMGVRGDGLRTSRKEALTGGWNSGSITFKERWIVETGFITGVSEVMKISSFMDAHKCPELAKRYSDKVPKTMNEMMTRLDDFLRSEEAFAKHGATQRGSVRSTQELRRQMEMALESGKLNHLIKDVRQRGRGNAKGRDAGKDKFINMIRSWPNDRKRKAVERDKSWMKALIVFPPLSMEDASDEPPIIEAVMEGYLVRTMDLVGFAGGVVKPLGTIKLEVVFGDGGLFRTVMIDFTVVREPSPYNIIFGRTSLRSIRAVSSTIHSMVREEANGRPEGQSEYQPRERSNGKGGFNGTNISQPSVPESTGNNKGEPFGTMQESAQNIAKEKRNLEAYVDDMVIKSNDEKVLIEDIAKTFDNLRRINMKLNPKKCSFGVEEGKFLGYMLTTDGIWANPKKTNVDMQSLRTLKEMQSLSRKLAVLKSRFADNSLPFFETLKAITKKNKDEYCWTKSAEKAYQEMKKVIVELPLLTTSVKDETLYVYVAAAMEAISAVLLAERMGKQCPIHYRLQMYFEAHPIKFIMDQPLKQILNKAQASKKLAEYLVELGAYNIAYEPINAIKGQVLADFLLEAPVGTSTDEFFRLPAESPNKDVVKRWTLFTDGASNSKGFRHGLILISPSGVEFMYALQMNFTSTNNEAEYEALLVKLHMEKKMKANYIIREIHMGSYGMDIGARNGHTGSPPSSSRKVKIFHCSHRLLYKVDRGEATGQNYQERRKEIHVGQYCVPVRSPPCDSNRQQNPVNGLVERANKSLMKGIKARLGRERAGWVDELPNVLWAYRTSLKQSNGETPFSLTYESEAVIPAEIGMPTHRTMMIREDENEDELRLNMDLFQERSGAAAIREDKYKTKMEQYYNQKVRPMSFKPDEYVFRRNEASRVEDQGKLGPKWEGPYRVTEAYQNGSYKLQTMGGGGASNLARSTLGSAMYRSYCV
nr:reverse transcriptase domain-containing protein [Tanacetum cinerariifolium]